MCFKNYFQIIIGASVLLFNCSEKKIKSITLTNTLNSERSFETVELSKELLLIDDLSTIGIQDTETKEILVTQTLDYDNNGIVDAILFQPKLEKNSKKTFLILSVNDSLKPKKDILCYSRFVPERTDDYAWENDKVAFRTFGPRAQEMKENNIPGGTLSSGIDLWLKKVEYSIIDKWYHKNLKEKGYYHKNHGEGYDPYHVGISRGTGGIGIWKADSLLTSKNFISYKTIAIGPLRTVFELEYAPWSEYGISETKRISLDLGSNFTKFEINLSSVKEVPNYAIGITLHDGEGDIIINKQNGLFGHWENIDNSYLGEGIIVDPKLVLEAFDYRTTVLDQSQLLILTKPFQKRSLIYYVGFGWSKRESIHNKNDWIKMLKEKVKRTNNPIKVDINW